MFALAVRFLLGRAQAATWDDRSVPEWPPHPDRLFSALVAAYGETGEDPTEAAALRWLETLPPPSLSCDLEVSCRANVTSYVPVNDTSDPIAKSKVLAPMGSLAIGRVRQPRTFPVAIPETPDVFFAWSDMDVPAEYLAGLEQLCRKVTYLGHSASPVQVWVDTNDHELSLVPSTRNATHRLRIFGPGRLDYLRARYNSGQRPQAGLWHGYASRGSRIDVPVHAGPYHENLLVLRRVTGSRVGLLSTLQLATALRDTLMSRYGPNPPEWLSGHQPTGEPSRRNRVALVPLGHVGPKHADGQLLGLGIALPRNPDDFSADALECLLGLLRTPAAIPTLDIEPGMSFVDLWIQGGPDPLSVGLELDSRPEEQ